MLESVIAFNTRHAGMLSMGEVTFASATAEQSHFEQEHLIRQRTRRDFTD